MTTEQIPFKISSLIARKLASEITEEEEAELNQWINASPGNKSIYELTIDPRTKAQRDQFVQGININEDWQLVEKKLSSTRSPRQVQLFIYRIAAAILIVAVALGVLISRWSRPQTPEAFEQEIARINPGKPQATIKLHNGQTILLSETDNQDKSFTETNGTSIYNVNGSVSYANDEAKTKEVIYNEINIPRGGEYKLVLSDGTKVWLNSETRLKFPVDFVSDERVVELQGEAYFEVTHDSERPFIVRTLQEAKVQVYGTSFNINAYADNAAVAITLNEGSVSVTKGTNAEVFLKPDQQAIVTSSSAIPVRTVDASAFSSWKDGLLVFDNLAMEDIAKLISRWYDVDFEFENETIKQYRFSADIKRYATFRDVLRIFEKTGQLSFEVHGKTIKVMSRKPA